MGGLKEGKTIVPAGLWQRDDLGDEVVSGTGGSGLQNGRIAGLEDETECPALNARDPDHKSERISAGETNIQKMEPNYQ